MIDSLLINVIIVGLAIFIFYIGFQLGKRFSIPQQHTKTLEELLDEKKVALEEEEYEKVIIINKEIKKIKNGDNLKT